MSAFKNRVYGCAVIKSINSNYNADFSQQPRTLPDGKVYATDKALKYSIRNFLNDFYNKKRVFYFKTYDEDSLPRTLDKRYKSLFGDFPTKTNEKDTEVIDRIKMLKNLLSCLDIRLFGATYAGEVNLSIHGPAQINHGINIWSEDDIYSEQIMSPFGNPNSEGQAKSASTLGRQSKLREGHYVHHYSINPNNILNHSLLKDISEEEKSLKSEDTEKFKEALRKGVTYYDSAAKAGTDNELLIWVQLKENSKAVLPNFTELITLERTNGKYEFDISGVKKLVSKYEKEEKNKGIEKVEIYYSKGSTRVKEGYELNSSDRFSFYDLETGKQIQLKKPEKDEK